MSKTLIIFGLSLAIIGLFLQFAGKIPYIGKLPGDIYVKKTNFQLYFPITTCLLISIVVTIIFYLLNKR
ncbi:MAG: DUF2905 domain-containing protein [Candidatus Omnitrophota bacterium]